MAKDIFVFFVHTVVELRGTIVICIYFVQIRGVRRFLANFNPRQIHLEICMPGFIVCLFTYLGVTPHL